jgi:hypothetical protein
MPLGYTIYPELQLLFIRGSGVTTHTEMVHAMLAWLHDPDYPSCIDAICDVSASESTPKIADLRELIAILRQHWRPDGPQRLAMVTSKPITYAVAEIFAQVMKVKGVPLQVKVFADRERAWEWLRPGLPALDPR